MQNDCISQVLNNNLSSLKEMQEKLQNIKDVKLKYIYSALESNNIIKTESTICIKIKNNLLNILTS